MSATVVWFRRDLRLADNPALAAAAARGAVVPVYVDDAAPEGAWPLGGAARWWRHHALDALDVALRARGSRLVLRRGATAAELLAVARQAGADAVYWNRRYEPAAAAHERVVEAQLSAAGLGSRSFNGSLLVEPWGSATREGRPFQVFTPFYRRMLAAGEPERPVDAPEAVAAPSCWPDGLALAALGLLPAIDWATGLRVAWTPGEAGAHEALERFLLQAAAAYPTGRDLLAEPGTSRLSPYLAHGELSPRQAWHAARRHAALAPAAAAGIDAFLRELAWREFAYHLLHHFPHTPERPLRGQFERLTWADDPRGLRAWQRGRTGYPVVDAAMRELWVTGWMHNRARMAVASFLAKDLLIAWQRGAAWFWDTLVDADLASNTLGWQWTAGCGADAAPWFRVFNPVSQGEKFDPHGKYVRRYLPVLAGLPDALVHRPWDAAPLALTAADIALDRDYPRPIVDHAQARVRALAFLKGASVPGAK